MGFRAPSTHYRLVFSDAKYDGLEITVKSADIGTILSLMDMSKLAKSLTVKALSEDPTPAAQAMRSMFNSFSNSLISWNLENDKDEPIPATKEYVYQQEPSFILMVIMQWMGAASAVAPPLPIRSDSGETSLMQSLTMEPL